MRRWPLEIASAGLICMLALKPSYAQDIGRPAIENQDSDACPTSPASDSPAEPDPVRVSIAEFTFEGDFHLPISEQTEIAASLKQRGYQGDSERLTAELEERLRRAWQDRGYFKVRVRGESKMLTSSPTGERVAFTAHVIEGPQYRLEKITFEHNRAILDTQALRNLFPISEGDIFSREKIETGLENLHEAYGQYGYVNFTAVPDTELNADESLINLKINVDEGKQFSISSVNMLGVEENTRQALLRDVPVKPGQIYNGRLVEVFWKRHPELLPVGTSPSSKTLLRLNEKRGTVAITFNLPPCTID